MKTLMTVSVDGEILEKIRMIVKNDKSKISPLINNFLKNVVESNQELIRGES